jgi:hypothetical protein
MVTYRTSSTKKEDYLYFIQADKTGMVKIGRSKHPEKRLKQLQTGSSNKLKLIACFENSGWREKILHELLEKWKVRANGEWFDYECVGSIPTDIYEQINFGAFDEWWER